MDKNKRKGAGRNIKITLTNDLPDGITEEEYRIMVERAELPKSEWIELSPNKFIVTYIPVSHYFQYKKKRKPQ